MEWISIKSVKSETYDKVPKFHKPYALRADIWYFDEETTYFFIGEVVEIENTGTGEVILTWEIHSKDYGIKPDAITHFCELTV